MRNLGLAMMILGTAMVTAGISLGGHVYVWEAFIWGFSLTLGILAWFGSRDQG